MPVITHLSPSPTLPIPMPAVTNPVRVEGALRQKTTAATLHTLKGILIPPLHTARLLAPTLRHGRGRHRHPNYTTRHRRTILAIQIIVPLQTPRATPLGPAAETGPHMELGLAVAPCPTSRSKICHRHTTTSHKASMNRNALPCTLNNAHYSRTQGTPWPSQEMPRLKFKSRAGKMP
jgi:hypothetical protein